MDTLQKIQKATPLYKRVEEIDQTILKMDETAEKLINKEISVNLSMIITHNDPNDMQMIHEEFNIPPIQIHGYPPVSLPFNIVLSKPAPKTYSDIPLPVGSTLAIMANMVGNLKSEKDKIILEIDNILKPNGGSKGEAKTMPDTQLL